jgi:hypothetical protein
MATRRKILSGVVRTEVIERNRRIRKLSRKAQRDARAVLKTTGRGKAKAAAAWKAWKKVARELSAEVTLQHSTLRLVRQNSKEDR